MANRCVRLLALVVLAAMAGFCWSSDRRGSARLLILIDSREVQATVSRDFYHTQWILWPAEGASDGRNRLLSLVTGVDWIGENSDFVYRRNGDAWIGADEGSLQRRGFFRAKAAELSGNETVALELPGAPPPTTALALAREEGRPEVSPRRSVADLPGSAIGIFWAQNWNDVGLINAQTTGRSLVVEYPPDPATGLSRAWFYGPWPAGVPTVRGYGIPGLLPARDAMDALMRPERLQWSTDDLGLFGTARHWVEHIRYSGPIIVGILAFFGAYIIGCAVYYILNEERAPVACWMLRLFYLSPAILVVAGKLTQLAGIQMWMLATCAAASMVAVLWGVMCLAARWLAPGSHTMWADSICGLLVMATIDPLWSFLSPVYTGDGAANGAAAGCLLMYLVGVTSMWHEVRWLPCLALFVWGATTNPWWVSGELGMLWIPAIGWMAGASVLRWQAIALLAVLADPTFRWARYGLVYAPRGLLPSYDGRLALNVAQHVGFLTSVPLLLFVACVAMLGFAGDRFLVYKIRRAEAMQSNAKPMMLAALACAAMGILNPVYLTMALMMAIGTLVVTIYDAAQPS